MFVAQMGECRGADQVQAGIDVGMKIDKIASDAGSEQELLQEKTGKLRQEISKY